MPPEFVKGFLKINCCYMACLLIKSRAPQCIHTIHCIFVEYNQKDHFKLANNFSQQEAY